LQTNDLKAADLNLPTDPRTANIAPPNSAPAAFIEVARDPTFTLAAFLLRKGASIPIHDHPGMIGICKVLYGKVRVTSFSPPRRIEFTSPTGTSSHGGYFGVDEEGSEELTADSPCTVLTPKQKNVHTIYALEHSAFFDVLGPPYAPEEGRNCNYYEDIPKTKFLDSDQMKKYERLRILKRIERPMWFYTELKPYTGPPAHARNV
jgi:cysteamine dioxygenase